VSAYEDPQETDPDDLIETAKKKVLKHLEERISDAAKWIEPMWRRAEENQRFKNEDRYQWDPADYKARRDSKRPIFTMRDIKLAVSGVSGREITARDVATFKPRQDEDAKTAEVWREWDRYCLQEANSEQMDSEAFRKLFIENYAWTQWRMNYDESPQGRMENETLDIWDMLWDPTARKKNLLDRMWDAWGGYIGIDDYLMMLPKEQDRIKELEHMDKMGFGDPKQKPTSRWPWLHRTKGNYFSTKHREVFAIDYEWKERAPAYDVLVPPGISPSSVSPEDLQDLLQQQQQAQQAQQQYEMAMQQAQATGQDTSQLQPPPPPPPLPAPEMKRLSEDDFRQFELDYADFLSSQPDVAEQLQLDPTPAYNGPADGVHRWRFRRALVVGRRIVKMWELKEGQFSRQCMTAVPYDRPEGRDFIGLVDDMKDAARFKNYLYSMGVSLLQRSHKGTMIYKPGYFDDEADAEKRLAQPFAMIKAGAQADLENGIRELETNTYPQGFDKWLAEADTAVWRTSGMNPQTLGSLPDARRVSGTVFSALTSASMVVLAEFFDSLRLQKKTAGRLRMRMTQVYFTTQDVQAVVGDFLAQFVPDEEHWQNISERQIIVEEGPAGESDKEEAWDFGTRQGSWDKLLAEGKMPLEVYVSMIPDRWLPQSMKQKWLQWADDENKPPAPKPPAPPVESINYKDVAATNPTAADAMLQRGGLPTGPPSNDPAGAAAVGGPPGQPPPSGGPG
jgi:hypothetical protein